MGKKTGKITAKHVQATEQEPFELPQVDITPERDDDEPAGFDGLNIRRRLFVEYITGEARGNAKKAARLAGYSDSNEHVLTQTASRLLTFVDVQQAIRERMASVRMTAEGTRQAIAAYASASMDAFLSVGMDGKPVMDWEKAAAAGAIGHIKEFREEGIEQGGSVSIIKRTFKIRDSLPALNLLAKMHGLVSETPATSVTVNVHQMSEDDLVRIATSSSSGSTQAAAGTQVTDRLRQRNRSSRKAGK